MYREDLRMQSDDLKFFIPVNADSFGMQGSNYKNIPSEILKNFSKRCKRYTILHSVKFQILLLKPPDLVLIRNCEKFIEGFSSKPLLPVNEIQIRPTYMYKMSAYKYAFYIICIYCHSSSVAYIAQDLINLKYTYHVAFIVVCFEVGLVENLYQISFFMLIL